MSRFIQFTSDYQYINNCKTYISATSQLAEWLKAHSEFEIIKWEAVPTGKDNTLTIVVEYKKQVLVDHY